MLSVIITLILVVSLCSGVFYGTLKVLRRQATKAVGKEREIIRQEIDRYDAAIGRALEYLNPMESLDVVTELDGQHATAQAELQQEISRVKKLETDLAELQAKVDKQEARHNELKKGKEDCDRIAEQITESEERVTTEGNELVKQISDSRTRVSSFTADAAFSSDHQSVLGLLVTTMQSMADRVRDLNEMHTQAAQRFMNLQTQYLELEKEYRKLVDKELSGQA